MTDDDKLSAEFDKVASYVRTIAEHLITDHFGERCPDFEPGCLACERWKLLDELLANPYRDADDISSDHVVSPEFKQIVNVTIAEHYDILKRLTD